MSFRIASRRTARTEIKLTGLSHGLGLNGPRYNTVKDYSSSTITFVGTLADIKADVNRVRDNARFDALRQGVKGRSHLTSWADAIATKVHRQANARLADIKSIEATEYEALCVLARTGNDSFVKEHGSVEALVDWLLEELTFEEAAAWIGA